MSRTGKVYNNQWFRDYNALCNEKVDLQRKLDALDDSHLRELEQEVCKKDHTLKSVNTSLHAFQAFAKELCTLLCSTPLSVSNAIHVIDTSGLFLKYSPKRMIFVKNGEVSWLIETF